MVLSPLTLSLPQAYRAPGMLVVQKVEVDPAATCASPSPHSLRPLAPPGMHRTSVAYS